MTDVPFAADDECWILARDGLSANDLKRIPERQKEKDAAVSRCAHVYAELMSLKGNFTATDFALWLSRNETSGAANARCAAKLVFPHAQISELDHVYY